MIRTFLLPQPHSTGSRECEAWRWIRIAGMMHQESSYSFTVAKVKLESNEVTPEILVAKDESVIELTPEERLAKRTKMVEGWKSKRAYWKMKQITKEDKDVPLTPDARDTNISKRKWEEKCRISRIVIKAVEMKESEIHGENQD